MWTQTPTVRLPQHLQPPPSHRSNDMLRTLAVVSLAVLAAGVALAAAENPPGFRIAITQSGFDYVRKVGWWGLRVLARPRTRGAAGAASCQQWHLPLQNGSWPHLRDSCCQQRPRRP